MNIVAFGASNSTQSINKRLAAYAASLVDGANVEVLDLNDFALPMFSEDEEKKLGQPDAAQRFVAKLGEADAIIVSFAEHNGSYTAAYKNLFDWSSRIEKKVFQGKPMVLLSTSPGPGGASSVLKSAETSAPYFDADVKAVLSVPSFYDNFDVEQNTLRNAEINEKLHVAVNAIK